jgi:molybdate transport system ATP-binding protein
VFPYLERLRDHSQVPMLYVSHSVEEVTRLAKTVVLMAKGTVVDVGPTAETLRKAGLKPRQRRSAKA